MARASICSLVITHPPLTASLLPSEGTDVVSSRQEAALPALVLLVPLAEADAAAVAVAAAVVAVAAAVVDAMPTPCRLAADS